MKKQILYSTSDLKEVVFSTREVKYSDKECPNCHTKTLVSTTIPCPDGREGCLVIHYGYACEICHKIFN